MSDLGTCSSVVYTDTRYASLLDVSPAWSKRVRIIVAVIDNVFMYYERGTMILVEGALCYERGTKFSEPNALNF